MINNSQIILINSTLRKYSPTRIGLFSSRVRGDENINSDLDILVAFQGEGKSPYSLLELLSIEKSLEDQLGFPIEIVNESNIKNNLLKKHIFTDLVIIYEQTERE